MDNKDLLRQLMAECDPTIGEVLDGLKKENSVLREHVESLMRDREAYLAQYERDRASIKVLEDVLELRVKHG